MSSRTPDEDDPRPACAGYAFTLPAEIPPLAAVPAMIVRDGAARPFPPSSVVPSTVVVRLDPVRAGIRRPRPVAVVPHVTASGGVVIALDPDILRTRARRHHVRARRRRRADANAERHLRVGCCRGNQKDAG